MEGRLVFIAFLNHYTVFILFFGLFLSYFYDRPHTLWWPTQNADGAFLPPDIPAPQLLRELQPNTKFLITLSDPVKRYYSDYYFLGDDLRPVRPGKSNGKTTEKSAKQLHERTVQQINLFNQCIKQYMKRLIPSYRVKNYENNSSSFSSTLPEPSSFFQEIYSDQQRKKKEGARGSPFLRREYLSYFPLWFRASQMCSHDRYSFGKGGWGRISIGLYSLFLEKWFEHFDVSSQFLVVRLEDYEENPKEYMERIFSFLGLPTNSLSEDQWHLILTSKIANVHRMKREPLLAETEQLLRDFYHPYNEILAFMMKNKSFLWEVDDDANNGKHKSLRATLLEELGEVEVSSQKQENSDNRRRPTNDHHLPIRPVHQQNQHSLDERKDPFSLHQISSSIDLDSQLHDISQIKEPEFMRKSVNKLRHSRDGGSGKEISSSEKGTKLNLNPKSFSTFDLPFPSTSSQPSDGVASFSFLNDSSLSVFTGVDLSNSLTAGRQLCKAAFSLNLHHLIYLLHEIGIPSDVTYSNDANRNAFHCLSTLWSMGEAHSKSHVFAELKGKKTWLTSHLKPALPLQQASVLSRDIIERLEEDVLAIAKWLYRAGTPHSAIDTGGFTPLHHAVVGGMTHLVSFLLSIGANPTILDKTKRAPLHYAAAYGHAELCKILIEANNEMLNLKDYNKVSPLDIISNPGPIRPEG
jgi:hypothetical protein